MDSIVFGLAIASLAIITFYGLGCWLQKKSKPREQYELLPPITLGEMEPWRLFELGWPNNGGRRFVAAKWKTLESFFSEMIPVLGANEAIYWLHRSTPVRPLKINW